MDMVPCCASRAAGTKARMSLSMDGMFFLQCNNSMPQFLSEPHSIVRRGLGSGHWIANAHGDGSRADGARTEREHCARPFQGDGNQGNPRLDGDIRGAFLEIAHFPSARPPTFGKDEQRYSFLADNLRCQGHGLHRRPRVLPGNANVTRSGEMPSQERNLKESTFGQEPKANR